MTPDRVNHELRSTLRLNGDVEIEVVAAAMPDSGQAGIVVEMLAAPVHPADMSLMFARADPATGRRVDRDGREVTLLQAGDAAANAQIARVDLSIAVGMEGSGRVVAAGRSEAAQALMGKLVAVKGDGVYASYKRIDTTNAFALPDGVSSAQGAGAFINPLTALGMVEIMRNEGFSALAHTAAASTVGQILCRLCHEEGIGLVNIVRRTEQADLLRSIGAEHVCVSTAENFEDALLLALSETGATLAFDAVGGGDLASRILHLMERATSKPAGYHHYGSNVRKKVLIYGTLDPAPVMLLKNYGLAWDVGGYLVFHFLESIGTERFQQLKQIIASRLTTTFAMHYNRSVSLRDLCDPDVLRAAGRRLTGDKLLIDFSS